MTLYQHEQKEKSNTSKLTISRRLADGSLKLIFLENQLPNEKMLFSFFDSFLDVESSSDRLYHRFGDTLYI